MKIVRDSAVRQEPAQPQAVSPEENRFSIRPRQIALFLLWMLAFTLLARGTSGALLPEVQLSTPAPNTITQSLTATGTIQWAAGSLFYLPEGLLVEAVFVSEGEAVQEGDKIAALRREDVEQKLRSLQAELAQKQTEYARLTKPVAADSYDLEKAQQALQAAYQAAENSAAAWAEKEANAGSERDALQRELNERQEKAAQYAREIAEKQAQRELLQQEESPDEEIISRIEAELTQLTAEETQNREALAEAEARLNEADAALESVQSQREEAARTAAQAAEQAELPQKALVVAQTTIRRDRFDSVLQVLRRRVPDLTERITICAATSQRQQEAERLSGEADVMVVVGGRNSSNTQKLLETCRLRCERSVLVETPEDVPPDLAKADDRVALTAGASTPQWLLEQVRARIEENAKTR